ncbi:Permease of the drug/metabolite transporter (DMT) superfamily [Leucobacter sp. 7(1)]|nr:Permease of the drug/metabolite transporter (DMT) superfamily [Leucobacter sp. 7(1)]
MAAFSLTVPLTRVAVAGLNPVFVGSGRAVVAAVLAIAALALTRQRLPHGVQWARLGLVAAGIVVGFPMLTSLALAEMPAARAAVVIGLLPAATAVVTVWRTGERPSLGFWVSAGLGGAAAVVFALLQGGAPGGAAGLEWPDLLLFGAVLLAALGYAEGGLLARELGAWQTVSWALAVALPVMLAITLTAVPLAVGVVGWQQWAAFGYLAVVSMFLGFFAWYRGLAQGPMATVSQVQLVQPVLSIVWAALLLGEVITLPVALGGLAVILCAGFAVRSRLRGGRTAIASRGRLGARGRIRH